MGIMFGLFKKPKLIKLRGLSENKKYGIAARSLKELLKKGCKMLQVPLPGSHICLYEDGTEVTDDYFKTLAVNAELVLLTKGQNWKGFVCDIGQLLGFSDRHTDILIESAQDLLMDEHSEKRRRILTDLLHNLKDTSDVEEREQDEDWFQGIESRFKTKSDYMKFNCENRIRGYMKDVEGYASSIQSAKVQREYKEVVDCMAEKLKSAKYNGCYFVRKEKERSRLCTNEGWFSCQGAFDQDKCSSLHSINPYGNRESRIVFSTWNLDHRIEKRRTIIPALAKALQGHKSNDINWDYFYRLLFTKENLKLVHIVCHKKRAHDLLCDSRQIYKKRKKI
ncbi:DNA fragmentation factor subunit beta isoform X1 [Anguilla anguilla]|uniref:DNA fragmentation factor subunit beta isoform X1 n=2 Tax=Anguilla anguilla TaxID=7936 RepID=UPI0015AC6F22|nr:DNA fragmentation factor subunit beta isoform X1 [Anguilla anguilla]